MITVADYLMGRDEKYASDLTDDIIANASDVCYRANELLQEFGEERAVNSGWRPPSVNAATAGAAKFSRHMTGEAIDLEDHHGDLDEWALANPDTLERIGLWQEHPSSTKGWAHFQIVPPRSGNRVFYP